MSDLLSIGSTGITAYQRNLSTVGNNITNVNTEGYSRQRVEQIEAPPTPTATGFVGNGVEVGSIRRVYDEFLAGQVTLRKSSFAEADSLYTLAARVDNVLSSESSSLDPAIQKFFNGVQDVANNPTSIPIREVMLTEANTLANRFRSLDLEFETLRQQSNAQIDLFADEITRLASSIAELNGDISVATANASGQPPNKLLDQRDLQLNRLAEIVSVRTVDTGDGSINVFIGSGQSLVLGLDSATLKAVPGSFDPGQRDILFTNRSTSVPIGSQLSGGELGGIVDFRRNVLDPAQDSLGRIAMAMADTFNAQHQLGDDLNGNPGGLFFSDIVSNSPAVFSNTANDPASGTFSVTIDDTNLLKASEYRLNYDGTNFSLLRVSDNTVVDSGFGTGDLPRSVAGEGITLDLTGSVAAGDSFLIRPVRTAARDISIALTDGAQFAAAASGGNTGDNTNALLLADLQNQKLLGNATETYQSAYGKLLGDVGGRTREAKVNSEVQQTLLNNAVDANSAVSGVNLDEEAADLVRYQQAYQASAQLIKIADSLFQTLLSLGR